MSFKVEVKNAKIEFFKLRSRFLKLQRTILADALFEASEPVRDDAQAAAPYRSGKLRASISPMLTSRASASRVTVAVGPHRVGRGMPFYGLFQELGWHTGKRGYRRTRKERRSQKFGDSRFIPGKHFLRNAGEKNFSKVEAIFASKVFREFDSAVGP